MCVGECAVCVWGCRSRPRWAPPLAGSRGRPGLRAPCGRAERTHGVGIRPALGPRGRCGAGWLEDWLVVGRARLLACSLGGSVGSGRLRGSDGPDRACLARLGSACDCVCLECVCVGRSPLKDRLQQLTLLGDNFYFYFYFGGPYVPKDINQATGTDEARERVSGRSMLTPVAHSATVGVA